MWKKEKEIGEDVSFENMVLYLYLLRLSAWTILE